MSVTTVAAPPHPDAQQAAVVAQLQVFIGAPVTTITLAQVVVAVQLLARLALRVLARIEAQGQ